MISFFFNEYGAGLIRGRQIGMWLGAKLNPKEGYEDDICIYVKMQPPRNFPKRSFVDIVDGVSLVNWLVAHPNCGAITTSLTGKRFLEKHLKQPVVFIPENHCNWECFHRNREKVDTVGIIGNLKGFNIPVKEVSKKLMEHGLFLQVCDNYRNREDVVSFYRTIDIQACWRPHVRGAHAQLHNPLKLANACSYGIPTVCFPEDNFRAEFDGCFYPAHTPETLFDGIAELASEPRLYNYLSKRGLEKAGSYDINAVSELYRRLE
jgi:hypothetical protein